MAFAEFERLSPNCDAGRAHERLGVLFHHSELDFGATIERMLLAESQVSYHCLIAGDGARCTLVRDRDIAWHAGASSWMGRTRCNDFMLGVAFEGDTYLTPLTAAQIASAVEWFERRRTPLGWDLSRIADHRQVSPGRKRDLNPPEWNRLAEAIAATCGAPPFPG